MGKGADRSSTALEPGREEPFLSKCGTERRLPSFEADPPFAWPGPDSLGPETPSPWSSSTRAERCGTGMRRRRQEPATPGLLSRLTGIRPTWRLEPSARSEERRVGKEWNTQWPPGH